MRNLAERYIVFRAIFNSTIELEQLNINSPNYTEELARIDNLFEIYIDIVDGTLFFDNSYGKHKLIAQRFESEEITILDSEKFNRLKKYYDKERETNRA